LFFFFAHKQLYDFQIIRRMDDEDEEKGLRTLVVKRMLELGIVAEAEHSITELTFGKTPLAMAELEQLVDEVLNVRAQVCVCVCVWRG
jgi:hypothetical protein